MKKNHYAVYRLTIREDEESAADYFITLLNLPVTGKLNEFRISISFKSPGTDPVSEYSKEYSVGKIPDIHELLPFLKDIIPVSTSPGGGKQRKEKIQVSGRNRQADVYIFTRGKGESIKEWYLDSYPLGGLVKASVSNRKGAERAAFIFLEKGRAPETLKKVRRKFKPDFYSAHALRPKLNEKQFVNYLKTHRRLLKKRDLSESGIILDTLNKTALKHESVFRKIYGADVILAGEVHDSPQTHRLQLDLISSLNRQGRDIVIGFEMFDHTRSIQKGLDDFIAGTIDENRFIHKVYNRCWSPDWYDLYRDIFIYARNHNIRLLGLNIPSKLMERFRNDPDSLSDKERSFFPGKIDYNDKLHRKITEWNFQGMVERGMKVDAFYPGQCIWEDTMSDAIVNFLMENPGICMVVCVGALHTAYRVSLPGRIKRTADSRGGDINTVSLFPHGAAEFIGSAYHDFMLMDIADFVYFIPPEEDEEEDDDLPDEDDELSWMEGYKLFSEGRIDEAALSLKGDYSFVAKKLREKIRIFIKSRDAALSGDFKKARNFLKDVPDIYDDALDIWMKKIDNAEKSGSW